MRRWQISSVKRKSKCPVGGPEQSYSERQQFEQALLRMARELAAVRKVDDDQSVKELSEFLAKNAKRAQAWGSESSFTQPILRRSGTFPCVSRRQYERMQRLQIPLITPMENSARPVNPCRLRIAAF